MYACAIFFVAIVATIVDVIAFHVSMYKFRIVAYKLIFVIIRVWNINASFPYQKQIFLTTCLN